MDKGEGNMMWNADKRDGTYSNPVLYTDYSDPDVIRVGDDFFLVASSFCNTPAVPVLHSKDLVNWRVISYAMERLPFDHYDKPLHGKGAWAPAIRYRDDTYYIFIPLPDEGIFMVKSKNPFDGWEEPVCVRAGAGWIDPCPFWDDDGKAYMVSAFAKSRIGFNSVLNLAPMKKDATALLDDGKIVFDGNRTQPTIEGPKIYKRNGYYYIFAPAGGVQTGWQTVLRAKDIWGPYEERIVLRQGNTEVNGPHQGAWVTATDGRNWFLHFQDVGNAGRIIHLQPMHWENDWPVIGENIDENGCGEPVMSYKKPVLYDLTGEPCPVFSPEASDFFEGEKLGLQWQWNDNYKEAWYALDGESLTLYAQQVEEGIKLCDVSNLLLQKWPAPEFQVTALVDVSNMCEGDRCGLVSLGGRYADFAVEMRDGKKVFVQSSGQWTEQSANAETETGGGLSTANVDDDKDTEAVLGEITNDNLYLRMKVEQAKRVSFSYSYDEEEWTTIGTVIEATPGRWVGVKVGLYAIHKGAGNAGYMKAESFVFKAL